MAKFHCLMRLKKEKDEEEKDEEEKDKLQNWRIFVVKLKKYRVHKAICDVCNGNGFVKIKDEEDPRDVNVHQCWECDSEGEFYVYEPKMVTDDDADNNGRTTNKFLH